MNHKSGSGFSRATVLVVRSGDPVSFYTTVGIKDDVSGLV
jgi:hypothetical protein